VLHAAWPEALVVFAIWGTAMAWTVGYCALFAYPGRENLDQAARELTYVFGFPSWVFWGIILPWLCCVVASFVVSNFVMADADLGIDPDEAMREIIGEDGDA
jgi:hypothetical protein